MQFYDNETFKQSGVYKQSVLRAVRQLKIKVDITILSHRLDEIRSAGITMNSVSP